MCGYKINASDVMWCDRYELRKPRMGNIASSDNEVEVAADRTDMVTLFSVP